MTVLKRLTLALVVLTAGCWPVATKLEEPPTVFVAPPGMVLVPKTVADQFLRDVNRLRIEREELQEEVDYWRSAKWCA